MTQSLDLSRLRLSLLSSPIHFELHDYATVGSTQDLVAAAAAGGAEEGLVVFADEQLAGRGRSGRRWVAPPGSSLMFSVLLRPASSAANWTTLSLAAGLAVVEGLAQAGGPPTRLKWPNDCLVGDRKLAGVLAESRSSSERGRVVIVGIGCNVKWVGAELPSELRRTATACDLAGYDVDRTSLAVAVLGRLGLRYQQWVDQGFGALREAWLARAAWIGQEVIAQQPSGPVAGRMAGLSEQGELLLETASGPIAVAAGDLDLAVGSGLRLGSRGEG